MLTHSSSQSSGPQACLTAATNLIRSHSCLFSHPTSSLCLPQTSYLRELPPDASISLRWKPGSFLYVLEADCSPAHTPRSTNPQSHFYQKRYSNFPHFTPFFMAAPSSGSPSCLHTSNSLLKHVPSLLPLCPASTQQPQSINVRTALSPHNIQQLPGPVAKLPSPCGVHAAALLQVSMCLSR